MEKISKPIRLFRIYHEDYTAIGVDVLLHGLFALSGDLDEDFIHVKVVLDGHILF